MLYFAYGSNLHHFQMKRRCKDSIFLKKINLKDFKLTFRSRYRAADIEPKKNSIVPGGLFEISKSDEKKLDIYEDYPILYKKFYFKYVKGYHPYSMEAVQDLLKVYKNNIQLIKGNSNQLLKDIQINNIDLIFIDGGHEYNTVKNDLNQSKKIISQNGTILCDDYNLSYAEGVKKAIDEFIKENGCKYEILLERFVKINL